MECQPRDNPGYVRNERKYPTPYEDKTLDFSALCGAITGFGTQGSRVQIRPSDQSRCLPAYTDMVAAAALVGSSNTIDPARTFRFRRQAVIKRTSGVSSGIFVQNRPIHRKYLKFIDQ